MFIKQIKAGLLGILLIALSMSAINYYQKHSNQFYQPNVITLSELKKDIIRNPVPVTGKVRNLHPPMRGDQHPH